MEKFQNFLSKLGGGNSRRRRGSADELEREGVRSCQSTPRLGRSRIQHDVQLPSQFKRKQLGGSIGNMEMLRVHQRECSCESDQYHNVQMQNYNQEHMMGLDRNWENERARGMALLYRSMERDKERRVHHHSLSGTGAAASSVTPPGVLQTKLASGKGMEKKKKSSSSKGKQLARKKKGWDEEAEHQLTPDSLDHSKLLNESRGAMATTSHAALAAGDRWAHVLADDRHQNHRDKLAMANLQREMARQKSDRAIRETLNKELERERALRLDAEKRLRESRAESSSWQSKVKAQKEDLSKMEGIVRTLLQYKEKVDQLKQEKANMAINYEKNLQKFRTQAVDMEQENKILTAELSRVETENQQLCSSQEARPASASASASGENSEERVRVLLERLKRMEEEKSALVLENERQQQQYDKCLDQIANQVVQALLSQKTLREECSGLKNRVLVLEDQNRQLTEAFHLQLPFTANSLAQNMSDGSSQETISASVNSGNQLGAESCDNMATWSQFSLTSLQSINSGSNDQMRSDDQAPGRPKPSSPPPWIYPITSNDSSCQATPPPHPVPPHGGLAHHVGSQAGPHQAAHVGNTQLFCPGLTQPHNLAPNPQHPVQSAPSDGIPTSLCYSGSSSAFQPVSSTQARPTMDPGKPRTDNPRAGFSQIISSSAFVPQLPDNDKGGVYVHLAPGSVEAHPESTRLHQSEARHEYEQPRITYEGQGPEILNQPQHAKEQMWPGMSSSQQSARIKDNTGGGVGGGKASSAKPPFRVSFQTQAQVPGAKNSAQEGVAELSGKNSSTGLSYQELAPKVQLMLQSLLTSSQQSSGSGASVDRAEGGLSPGTELLKISDSFQENLASVQFMDSDNDDPDAGNQDQSGTVSDSHGSTMSLNDILDQNLDSIRTPLDDEMSVDDINVFDSDDEPSMKELLNMAGSDRTLSNSVESSGTLCSSVCRQNQSQTDYGDYVCLKKIREIVYINMPDLLNQETILKDTTEQTKSPLKRADSNRGSPKARPNHLPLNGNSGNQQTSACCHGDIPSNLRNSAALTSALEELKCQAPKHPNYVNLPKEIIDRITQSAEKMGAVVTSPQKTNSSEDSGISELSHAGLHSASARLGVSRSAEEQVSSPDSALHKSGISSDGAATSNASSPRAGCHGNLKDDGYYSNSANSVRTGTGNAACASGVVTQPNENISNNNSNGCCDQGPHGVRCYKVGIESHQHFGCEQGSLRSLHSLSSVESSCSAAKLQTFRGMLENKLAKDSATPSFSRSVPPVRGSIPKTSPYFRRKHLLEFSSLPRSWLKSSSQCSPCLKRSHSASCVLSRETPLCSTFESLRQTRRTLSNDSIKVILDPGSRGSRPAASHGTCVCSSASTARLKMGLSAQQARRCDAERTDCGHVLNTSQDVNRRSPLQTNFFVPNQVENPSSQSKAIHNSYMACLGVKS